MKLLKPIGKNSRHFRVKTEGIIPTFLDFGELQIQTAGTLVRYSSSIAKSSKNKREYRRFAKVKK